MATLWCLDAKKRSEFSWDCEMWVRCAKFCPLFLFRRQHHMLSKEECQGDPPLNICRVHVCVLTIALLGSRLYGQVCKRVSASTSKHCGTRLSSLFILALAPTAPRLFLAYRQHKFHNDFRLECMSGCISELQTHPDLHSPVWVGRNDTDQTHPHF